MSGVFRYIDPPTPLSIQRVCPPPALAGRWGGGGGGSIFWKTPDIGLASSSIISLRATVYTSSYLWLGESSKNSKAGLGKHLSNIEKTSQKSIQLAMSNRGVYEKNCTRDSSSKNHYCGTGSGIRIRDEQLGLYFLELRNHFLGENT